MKKLVVFAFALCIIFLSSCTKNSDFKLGFTDFYSSPVTEISQGSSHFYKFTDEQKIAFSNFFEKNGDAAVMVYLKPLKIKESDNGDAIDFGFIYEEDASLKNLSSRPVVTDSFNRHWGAFALSMCVDKDKKLPAGFFIKSKSRFTVEQAQIIRGIIGHVFRDDYPLYAFGPNGGTNNGTDDFSGASLAFSSVTNQRSVMPVFTISFAGGAEGQKISFGGETLNIRGCDSAVEIPASALKSPFSIVNYPDGKEVPPVVMLTASAPELLTFSVNSKNPVVPFKVDPGLIMSWSRNNWRGNDYELFEWDRFPGVLIMDIASYAVQDDFFRRLAFYVEKAGYRGKLLSDDFLNGKHGYNAHDYRAESLAQFFEAARRADFPLNSRELLLKEILIRNGVINEAEDGAVSEGRGAVISISQESTAALRSTFIAHEGWHGIFFVDDDFRNTVASVYYTLDPSTLKYLKRYFQVTPSLNYDVNDEYLMKNEFMAYMLQRPVSATGQYFMDMAMRNHSQTYAKAEADYVIETNAQGFVSAASLLDEYVYDRWKLNAGRVWLISR